MINLRRVLVHQFGNPRGLLGRLAGLIMTVRPSNRERILKTIELLDVRPDDCLLEVGFGPGLGIERALQLASRGLVVGVDHSELMLRQAGRRNARALANGQARLLLGSAERLAEIPTRYDKVFAVNVYLFWDKPVAMLRDLRNVMSPGGVIALTTQPRNRGASIEDTRKVADLMSASLSDADFQEVRIEILSMRPVPAACVLGKVS